MPRGLQDLDAESSDLEHVSLGYLVKIGNALAPYPEGGLHRLGGASDHIGIVPGDVDLPSDEGEQIPEPRKMVHVPVGQEHRPQLQPLGPNELQDLPGISAGVDEKCLSPLVPEKIAVRPKLAQWKTFVLHRRSQLLIPIPNHSYTSFKQKTGSPRLLSLGCCVGRLRRSETPRLRLRRTGKLPDAESKCFADSLLIICRK